MIERSEAIRVAPELGPILESMGPAWPYIVRWTYRFGSSGSDGLVYILCYSGEASNPPMYAVMTANVKVMADFLFVHNLGTYKCADSLPELLEMCPKEWRDILFPDEACMYCGELTCGVEFDCETVMRLRDTQHKKFSEVHGYRGPHYVSDKEAARWMGGYHEDCVSTDPDLRFDVAHQLRMDRKAVEDVMDALKHGRSVFEEGENLDD